MSYLQIFGTALSAYGSLQKGAAQRTQQRQLAAQREAEGEMLKLQALQRQNDRVDQLEAYRKQMNVMAAINRRSVVGDRSVQALLRAAEDKNVETLKRESLQSLYGIGQQKYAAASARYAGNMAFQSALLTSASGLSMGIYQYQDVKDNTGGDD